MPDDNEVLEESEMWAEPVVVEEPELPLDIEEWQGVRTLADAEEETPHITDLQAILKSLTPKFKVERMNDLLQPQPVSRIFPDNYQDLHYLLAMSMIEEQEDENDIDFVYIITGTQAMLSIGFEGRGIADRLEIAGVAHEEEYEKLAKEFGMM